MSWYNLNKDVMYFLFAVVCVDIDVNGIETLTKFDDNNMHNGSLNIKETTITNKKRNEVGDFNKNILIYFYLF